MINNICLICQGVANYGALTCSSRCRQKLHRLRANGGRIIRDYHHLQLVLDSTSLQFHPHDLNHRLSMVEYRNNQLALDLEEAGLADHYSLKGDSVK